MLTYEPGRLNPKDLRQTIGRLVLEIAHTKQDFREAMPESQDASDPLFNDVITTLLELREIL